MKRLLICLLLLACTACATPCVQPESSAQREPELRKRVLIARDATPLPLRVWLPSHAPRAVIVALHGFNDYSRGFVMPGEYLSHRGIAVYAYDQRGFGTAPGAGIWPGEDNLVRDAAAMVAQVKKRYPHTPVYLLGESMGGAVAIDAASRAEFPKVDGIILSAPALWGGSTMNPLFRMTLWAFAHTVPDKRLTGEGLHILASDNIPMLRGLGADPLIIKATRVDAIYGLVQMMDRGYANIDKVKTPILLLYGAHDQVIPPDPILAALRKAPEGTIAAYYPRGFHMLLRDLHRNVPEDDIIAWIEGDRDGDLPSGFDTDADGLAEKLRRNQYSPVWQHVGARAFPLHNIVHPQ